MLLAGYAARRGHPRACGTGPPGQPRRQAWLPWRPGAACTY